MGTFISMPQPPQQAHTHIHYSFYFSLFHLGKLVIADSDRLIVLRTKHILIGNKGELHIGSKECPYRGNLTISLFGRYWDIVLHMDETKKKMRRQQEDLSCVKCFEQ